MSYYDDDTIDQDSFDVKNYSLSICNTNDKLFKNSPQFALFPTYTYSNGHKSKLIIKTDPIRILQHSGIPKVHERWRENNNKCMYFHIAFSKNDNGSMKLYNNVVHPINFKNMTEIATDKDESKFACCYNKDSEIVPFKDLFYNSMIKKIINFNEEYEDSDDDKPTGDIIGKIKVNLDIEHDYDRPYDSKIEDKIKTEVYIKQKNGTIVKREIENLDDLRKILKFGCKAEFELNFYKLWINKCIIYGHYDNKCLCGMSIKCTKMLIYE